MFKGLYTACVYIFCIRRGGGKTNTSILRIPRTPYHINLPIELRKFQTITKSHGQQNIKTGTMSILKAMPFQVESFGHIEMEEENLPR